MSTQTTILIYQLLCSSRHPSVSRDNGKASLLGVETQKSYLSHGMRQDEKIEKWNQEEKAFY